MTPAPSLSMRDAFSITDIRLHPARAGDRAKGLRCFASCTVNGWNLDSLVVRRTRDGRYQVQWPCRVDANGTEHLYFCPADPLQRKAMRVAVEVTVLAHARRARWIS